MTRYLITPSLHSSWHWYLKMEAKTKEDFLNTLRKVREPATEAMLKGIDFENAVLAVTEGKPVQFDDAGYLGCVQEVASIVQGGIWQDKVMMDVNLCGMDFLLYGKTDVIKKDWIYDIKFTQNYDVGKYTDSVQHPLYMACTGIHKFAYLVSDGESVWREDYFWAPDTAEKLRGRLAEMINHIHADKDFWEAYQANWKTYGEKQAA